MEKDRRDIEAKIASNEQIINDFKASLSKLGKDVKSKYEVKMDDYERKNKEMKTKLSEFKDIGAESWQSFKSEFTSDIDEIGRALKNLTSNKTD